MAARGSKLKKSGTSGKSDFILILENLEKKSDLNPKIPKKKSVGIFCTAKKNNMKNPNSPKKSSESEKKTRKNPRNI